jgi:hypothetical protein
MQDNPVWTLGSSVELAGGKGSGDTRRTEHPHRTYSTQPRRTQHLHRLTTATVAGVSRAANLFERFGFLPAPARLPPRCFLIGVESVSGGFSGRAATVSQGCRFARFCTIRVQCAHNSIVFIYLRMTAARSIVHLRFRFLSHILHMDGWDSGTDGWV